MLMAMEYTKLDAATPDEEPHYPIDSPTPVYSTTSL